MRNNDPIWFNKQEPNKDTYQTINQVKVEPKSVMEINLSGDPKYKIMVCTPCHSDVSMHYTQAVLKFQQECLKNNILVIIKIFSSHTR